MTAMGLELLHKNIEPEEGSQAMKFYFYHVDRNHVIPLAPSWKLQGGLQRTDVCWNSFIDSGGRLYGVHTMTNWLHCWSLDGKKMSRQTQMLKVPEVSVAETRFQVPWKLTCCYGFIHSFIYSLSFHCAWNHSPFNILNQWNQTSSVHGMYSFFPNNPTVHCHILTPKITIVRKDDNI